MTVVRMAAAVATIVGIALLAGCAAPRSAGGIMAAEGEYGLYREDAFPLVTLNAGADAGEFWRKLARKAEASDQGNIAVRIERLSERVVRVQRTNTQFGSKIAVHMAIYDEPTATGARRIKLQPLIAWTIDEFVVGGDRLMKSGDARPTIAALSDSLPNLAANLN